MTITADPTTPVADAGTTVDWVDLADRIGRELAPEVAERDRTGEISVAAFQRLRDAGITAALIPADQGGGGASHAEMGAMLRAIGRHDPSTAVTLAMHSHLVALQVWRHHRGMDATGVFKKVVDQRAVLVSTGASDWAPSNGTATKVDGGYRITARKAPVSGCEIGDVAVTSIRWDDAPDGPQVLHGAVPLSADGVSIEHTWDTLGLRATGSHTIVFDDVFLPDAAVSLTRPVDTWPPILDAVIGAAMPLIMAAYVGIADAAVELAVASATARNDGGEPAVPTVLLLGEMMTAHTLASDAIDAMFVHAENLRFANTDEVASQMLSRKTSAAGALIDTVRLAIEVVGGAGFSRSSDLERLYRDVHGVMFHPLPRAKQTEFTGRVALGLSPTP